MSRAALLQIAAVLMVVIVITVCTTIDARAQYDNCKESINEDGIKVFACNNPKSTFRSVKAEFEVDVSIEKFKQALFDIPSYTQWQYKTVNPRVLERHNENELTYYAEIESPWPFSNRDLIARMRCERDSSDEGIRFIYRGQPDYLPISDGIMRVPSSASEFHVVSIAADRVHVIFYSTIDPGGQVPAWMINLVGCEGPFISFKKLRARLEGATGHR
jgi:hypothetical protein